MFKVFWWLGLCYWRPCGRMVPENWHTLFCFTSYEKYEANHHFSPSACQNPKWVYNHHITVLEVGTFLFFFFLHTRHAHCISLVHLHCQAILYNFYLTNDKSQVCYYLFVSMWQLWPLLSKFSSNLCKSHVGILRSDRVSSFIQESHIAGDWGSWSIGISQRTWLSLPSSCPSSCSLFWDRLGMESNHDALWWCYQSFHHHVSHKNKYEMQTNDKHHQVCSCVKYCLRFWFYFNLPNYLIWSLNCCLTFVFH